jgi:hypothetical protein
MSGDSFLEVHMRASMALATIGLACGFFAMLAVATPARADACFDLWVARNSIYKAYGYCFKTPKAIAYFGNAGCMYDNEGDIPMSRADRNRVLAIKRQERALGCL